MWITFTYIIKCKADNCILGEWRRMKNVEVFNSYDERKIIENIMPSARSPHRSSWRHNSHDSEREFSFFHTIQKEKNKNYYFLHYILLFRVSLSATNRHAHTKHSCTRLRRAHTDTRRHAQTVTHTHTRTRTHTHTGKERLKKRILCFLCVGTRVVYIFQHHGQRRFLCRS